MKVYTTFMRFLFISLLCIITTACGIFIDRVYIRHYPLPAFEDYYTSPEHFAFLGIADPFPVKLKINDSMGLFNTYLEMFNDFGDIGTKLIEPPLQLIPITSVKTAFDAAKTYIDNLHKSEILLDDKLNIINGGNYTHLPAMDVKQIGDSACDVVTPFIKSFLQQQGITPKSAFLKHTPGNPLTLYYQEKSGKCFSVIINLTKTNIEFDSPLEMQTNVYKFLQSN